MRGPTIGVDIGGTKVLLMANWPDGRPPELLRLATGPGMSPGELERYITRFTANLGAQPWALGIAVPGLVDTDRVLFTPDLPLLEGWRPEHLLGDDVPQVLINDVNAALIGETSALPPEANVVMLVVGTGIGMAFTADGREVTGSRGWAGELGSIPMATPSGARSLDEIAGGAAILVRTGLGAEEVHGALTAGDPQICDMVRQAGEALGLAIAIVIDLLNPEVVIVAGGTLTYPGYLTAALATAERTTLAQLWQACTIRPAANPPLAVAMGAVRAAERARQAR